MPTVYPLGISKFFQPQIKMNYYVPTILSIMSLDEACQVEPQLYPNLAGILATHGHPTFTAPVAAQLVQSDFPELFPNAHWEDGPVVIIGLPDSMEDDFEALASSPLTPMNVYSRDLMEKTTCLVLSGQQHELQFTASGMAISINGITALGLMLIFICGEKFWIVRQPLDKDWRELVGYTSVTGGENYKPYGEWTDAEIADAAGCTTSDDQALQGIRDWRPELLYRSR